MKETIYQKIQEDKIDIMQDIQNSFKDYKIYKQSENLYIDIDILISYMEKINQNPRLNQNQLKSLGIYLKENMPAAIIEDIKYIMENKEKENYYQFAKENLLTTDNQDILKFSLILISQTGKSQEFKQEIMEISKAEEYVLYTIQSIKTWTDQNLFEILKNSKSIGKVIALENMENLTANQKNWLLENIENIPTLNYMGQEIWDKINLDEMLQKNPEPKIIDKSIELINNIIRSKADKQIEISDSYIQEKLDIILETIQDMPNYENYEKIYQIVENLHYIRQKSKNQTDYNNYIQEIYFMFHKKEILETIKEKAKNQGEPWLSIEKFLGIKG